MSEFSMKVINGTRRSGKTTKAVEWVKEGRNCLSAKHNERLLLVISELERRRLVAEYDLDLNEVMTYEQFQREPYHFQRRRQAFIDNVDIILSRLCGGQIVGFSYSEGGY